VTNSKAEIVPLQRLVQDFFEQHLSVERNASRHTVLAYRDALKLFFNFAAEKGKRSVDELGFSDLQAESVRSFLNWLGTERSCAAPTRNHRLAAIKSFARYVASVAPEHLERCRRIRDLRPAAVERPEVGYLDQDEIVCLLQSAQKSNSRRDFALLLLLYNTGARVQELIDLDVADLRFDPVPLVTLQGKGRKQRTCPIWKRTVEALKAWIRERGPQEGPLFLNRRGHRLSRSGVTYILDRITQKAQLESRNAKAISPHVIRHSTAMHLLQAGVDLTTIAAWLGHAHLSTTHGYVEIDLRMKQEAVALTNTLPSLCEGEHPKGELLRWLESLGKNPRYAERPPPLAATNLP